MTFFMVDKNSTSLLMEKIFSILIRLAALHFAN